MTKCTIAEQPTAPAETTEFVVFSSNHRTYYMGLNGYNLHRWTEKLRLATPLSLDMAFEVAQAMARHFPESTFHVLEYIPPRVGKPWMTK